jgi:hypothetical protein
MYQPSPKNSKEYHLTHQLFKEMATNLESITYIEQEIERNELYWNNFKRAFENAKNKIEAS